MGLAPYVIVAISIAASTLVEVLVWLLVGSTSRFKAMRGEAEAIKAKMKAHTDAGKSKEQTKYQSMELALARINGAMFVPKFKLMVINLVVLGGAWRLVTSWYGGQVVAKLPDAPIAFFRNVTHRGLPGDDLTDCSSHAIYALSQMLVKGTMAKFVNTGIHKVLAVGPSPESMFNIKSQ
ncbi:integral membrane protein DUF106-domain-containing protein [Haematococcus lacustris]